MNHSTATSYDAGDLLLDVTACALATPTQWGVEGRAEWFVRSSAAQKLRNGQPIGFRHDLCFAGKVINTGVGADVRRTFAAQAEYFNSLAATPAARTSKCANHLPEGSPKHIRP